MKLTNKLDLPDYLYQWLCSDSYDHDHDPYTISATTLMKPTRATLLTIRHTNRLQQDVSDLIASRVGNAIHDSIEKIETKNVLKETRAERAFTVGPVTYKVTGKFDIMVVESNLTYTLRDIKTTSVWAYILGGKDEEYRKQLSIYRWLNSTDKKVNDIGYVDFFFTDWQSSKARQDRNYPQYKIYAGYKINLMSLKDTEDYIRDRLTAIEADRNKADNDLTKCTLEELWAEPEKYAVYKHKAKKATRVLDSYKDAKEYIQSRGIKGFIQKREAKVKRCNYCASLQFCNQGQEYLNKGLLA